MGDLANTYHDLTRKYLKLCAKKSPSKKDVSPQKLDLT